MNDKRVSTFRKNNEYKFKDLTYKYSTTSLENLETEIDSITSRRSLTSLKVQFVWIKFLSFCFVGIAASSEVVRPFDTN